MLFFMLFFCSDSFVDHKIWQMKHSVELQGLVFDSCANLRGLARDALTTLTIKQLNFTPVLFKVWNWKWISMAANLSFTQFSTVCTFLAFVFPLFAFVASAQILPPFVLVPENFSLNKLCSRHILKSKTRIVGKRPRLSQRPYKPLSQSDVRLVSPVNVGNWSGLCGRCPGLWRMYWLELNQCFSSCLCG